MSSVWDRIGSGQAAVCVLGLARSGRAATRLLQHRGARVRGLELKLTDEARAAWEPLAAAGAELVEGPHPLSALDDCGLLIRSPGVPADAPFLGEARRRGIPVRSELALAADMVATPLLAITGTNGKSTTTAWTAHLLRRAGVAAVGAGNIGRCLSDAVLDEADGTVFVVEVSSFQLEDSPEFHPRAAAILNITPDHIDRHGSFDAYRAAKWSIAGSQNPGDLLVLGPTVELLHELGPHARVVRCEPERAPAPEETDLFYVAHGAIHSRLGTQSRTWLPVRDLALPGPHNLVNAMAAAALSTAVVTEADRLVTGLRDFPGLPHRLEEVGRIGGVRLINDSKSTNVDSLRVALQSFTKPVVLIAGGRDKGAPFAELADLATRRVKRLVAMGEAAQTMRDAWPGVPSERVGDLAEALERALDAAGSRGTVLLSPGCASFDMFRNYEERGDRFRDLVRARVAKAGGGEAR